MKINRRSFFKTLGLVAGAVTLGFTTNPKAIVVNRPHKPVRALDLAGIVAKTEGFADGSMTVRYEVDGKPFSQVHTKANGEQIHTDLFL